MNLPSALPILFLSLFVGALGTSATAQSPSTTIAGVVTDAQGGTLPGAVVNAMSGRAPYSGSASFGRVLGAAQQWGVVVGGSYSRRHYDSELFRVAESWGAFNGWFVPQNQAFFLYDVDRIRQGINAAVEYRPSQHLRLFVEGRNLNDEPRINYAGDRNRRTAHEIYSRDVYAGIDWRF